MTPTAIKRIPYATADYRKMRNDNSYYVDKTRFIPMIEAAPYYLFFIRPRRFGKTLWLSVLQHYYDVNLRDEFEFLFAGTYIGQNPTAERNGYLVMFLNFAGINPDPNEIERSFEDNSYFVIQTFVERYERFFEARERETILSGKNTEERLRRLLYYTDQKGLKTFLLIDEYDNFANTILSTSGAEAYHKLTHGEGFFRYFFNLLKSLTAGQSAGLTRLFITGVSPVTMDDVTSGFNIGTNISLDPRFNEMVGFTQNEVVTMLDTFVQAGALPVTIHEHLPLMSEWYNHYRFGKNAQKAMYNSAMVLYFVMNFVNHQQLPDELIDQNVRIDYNKLRHLMSIDKQLNGNFSQLRSIIESGEAVSNVVSSFPLSHLRTRENFISLLVYFGLLTFAGTQEGEALLRIPNRTVKDLMYSYIRRGFDDVEIFRINLWQISNLLQGLAYRGEWQPLFDFLTSEIQKQTSIRDYLNGEKVIQGFLLAYLNVTHFFLIWPEHEMGGGFVDLYLQPFLARYPDMRFGYLIELKYIARGEYNEELLQEKIAEAATQLKKHLHDERVEKVANKVTIKPLILVYNGWELVYCQEWDGTINQANSTKTKKRRPGKPRKQATSIA